MSGKKKNFKDKNLKKIGFLSKINVDFVAKKINYVKEKYFKDFHVNFISF
jgi:hypothetical protein